MVVDTQSSDLCLLRLYWHGSLYTGSSFRFITFPLYLKTGGLLHVDDVSLLGQGLSRQPWLVSNSQVFSCLYFVSPARYLKRARAEITCVVSPPCRTGGADLKYPHAFRQNMLSRDVRSPPPPPSRTIWKPTYIWHPSAGP